MTERFDALVVGAGLAGATAAATLARGGARTALLSSPAPPGIDPGDDGILWGHDLETTFPDWAQAMPIERHLIEKRLVFLDVGSSVSVDFHDASWDARPYAARTVLRARTEPWLSGQAERAGATLLPGPPVDHLLRTGSGPVTGVARGGESIEASVTIVTEDPTGRIVPPRRDPGASRGAREMNVQETYPLDTERVNERFGLRSGQGIALECVLGFLSDRILAGGYLHTNASSLTLGAHVRLDTADPATGGPPDVLAELRRHPAIAPYLDGSEPEDRVASTRALGPQGRPALFEAGALVAGRAAGLRFANGVVHQDLNYEVRTGALAGASALRAVKANDVSHRGLGEYRAQLRRAGILDEVARSDRADVLVRWNPRLHRRYPRLLTEAFHRMMTEAGGPKTAITRQARDARSAAGVTWWDLARDALSAGSQL